MQQIQNLTDNALQQQTLVLSDGTLLSLTINYSPSQYGWFIQNLTYGTFQLNGVRITNSPNMLYQFRHQIPFGLACFSTAGREATQQGDFATGEATLYVLSSAEVTEYVTYLQGGAL